MKSSKRPAVLCNGYPGADLGTSYSNPVNSAPGGDKGHGISAQISVFAMGSNAFLKEDAWPGLIHVL